jgi:hypothetical protein
MNHAPPDNSKRARFDVERLLAGVRVVWLYSSTGGRLLRRFLEPLATDTTDHAFLGGIQCDGVVQQHKHTPEECSFYEAELLEDLCCRPAPVATPPARVLEHRELKWVGRTA